MILIRFSKIVLLGIGLSVFPGFSQELLTILLPERTRLLQDQRVDLVIEARNMTGVSGLRVTANGQDITSRFSAPSVADLDCDGRPDARFRADLVGFDTPGWVRIQASVNSSTGTRTDIKDIWIQAFSLPAGRRNVVLYIGDAMGTTYRDAARLVARSVETVPGVSGLREGFFDRLLEMDKMPVSGMSMTYASDRVIPDSANTATAWSTGNKTFEGALGVFADGTDCGWRISANSSTLSNAIDNPKVETLWEYMKRKYNYRTGVVSTAFVTDATPAGEGAHTASRQYTFEVARQYLENPTLGGQPVFDVILGGGREDFDPDIRLDGRDLVKEFQAKGYQFVGTATDLKNIGSNTSRLLGLFRRPNTVGRASSGIRPTANGNMDVAYDKLGLTRPGSEPLPALGSYTDQPFLDLMTQKAIQVLSGPDGAQPFILMVEGASIDKQSHPNHAAGTIWDTIELDKAVGAGRAWAKARRQDDTLLVVTADHDQSMHIIGTTATSDTDLSSRASTTYAINAPVGAQRFLVYGDANANVRAAYGYRNSSDATNSTGPNGAPANIFEEIYQEGFPNYIDGNGDGYPENAATGGKGNVRLSVGFRTGNHTGSSVPVTAEGPGAFLFTGYMDQTDIMFKMAVSLTGDTVEGDAFVKNVLLHPKYPFTFGKF